MEAPTKTACPEFIRTLWFVLKYPHVYGAAVKWDEDFVKKPTVKVCDMDLFIHTMNENRRGGGNGKEWATDESIKRAFYKYGFIKDKIRQVWHHPNFSKTTKERDLIHVNKSGDTVVSTLSKRFDALHEQLLEETAEKMELLARMKRNEELIERMMDRVTQLETQALLDKYNTQSDDLLDQIQSHPDWEGVPPTPAGISLTEEWTGTPPPMGQISLWCDEVFDVTGEETD